MTATMTLSRIGTETWDGLPYWRPTTGSRQDALVLDEEEVAALGLDTETLQQARVVLVGSQ
jgi:hypothetical protein